MCVIPVIDMTKTGMNIVVLRKKAGLSEEEVGKCLNVGKSTISRYEKGQLSIPAETLPVIAARCNQSPNRFFQSEESIMEDCQILLNTMRDFFRHHKKNYENTEKQKEDSSKEVMDEFEFEENHYIAVSLVVKEEIQEGMYLYRAEPDGSELEISRIEDPEEFEKVSAFFETR